MAAVVEGRGAVLTVNTSDTAREANAELSLVEALLVANGVRSAAAGLTDAERALIVGEIGGGDRIEFRIPGDGVHLIELPENGLPTINRAGTVLDGYSQPGAKPNDAGIHESNNAVIKIVVDGRNGQVNSEQDLLTIKGDDVIVRGISFLSTFDETVYGINFRGSASGGQVCGCWIGVHPDGQMVSGGEIGVGVCCDTGGGHVIGTNGDGVDDRAEFNVIVGHNVNSIIEESPDVRISGNFIGVMPSGLTIPPVDFLSRVTEGDAIEGAFIPGLIIGTNGDGIGDSEEGNVIGGMGDEVIEIWDGNNEGVVIAGNYVGVGIDGKTALGNQKFMNVVAIKAQVGSNFDGVSDLLEANILANHESALFEYSSDKVFLNVRGNRMFNNVEPIFSKLTSSFFAHQVSDVNQALFPVFLPGTSGERLLVELPVSAGAGLAPAEVDLYLADLGTLGLSPQGAFFLARFVDNGPLDQDDRNRFVDVPLSEVAFPFSGIAHFVTMSYIEEADDAQAFGVSDVSDPFEVSIIATPQSPPLALAIQGPLEGHVILTFSGVLESAISPTGPWIHIDSTSPYTIQPEGSQLYFRVR